MHMAEEPSRRQDGTAMGSFTVSLMQLGDQSYVPASPEPHVRIYLHTPPVAGSMGTPEARPMRRN